MKYIKTFEETISPKNMDGFVDELVKELPDSIEKANEIGNKYGVDVTTHDEFVSSLGDDPMKDDVPPKGQFIIAPFTGINFGVMNKFTNNMNLVVHYPTFLKFLKMNHKQILGIVKSMMSHESIHKSQFDRMGNDPSKYILKGSPVNNKDKYLGHHTEIMAYAFSLVDELKRSGKSREEIERVIRRGKGYWVIDLYRSTFGKDHKVFKKFRKYSMSYLSKLFDDNVEVKKPQGLPVEDNDSEFLKKLKSRVRSVNQG